MRKTFGLLTLLASLCFPKVVQAQQPIRINCGGVGFTDSKGQVWQADFGYNTGLRYSSSTHISGTSDPTLFQSERYNSGSSPMIYSFPVANGLYHLNLLFAESYGPLQKVGARVFNIKVQNNLAFQNLDIFAAVGANAALVKGMDVSVQNGVLGIEFDNSVQNAKVDGIEILPLPSPSPQLNLKFNYPDGTPVAGTLNYSISSSLLSFQGNAPLTNGQAQCVLFSNPSTLGISAQFTVNLNLTDSTGHQLWQLSLGMNPAQVNLGAIQTSSLNVVVQKL